MMEKQRLQNRVNKQYRQIPKDTDRYRPTNTQNKNLKDLKKQGKLIRRQKVMIQKTVEDEPCHKLADLGIYEPQTPQHIKTQKQDMIKGRKNDDVNSFQMEDSFENKHLTVKRQYIAEPYELQKEDITLKDKSDNNEKKRNKAVNKDRLEIQQFNDKQSKKSGNGLLKLSKGWCYKGEYIQGLFHGYGQLYHYDMLIYSGSFEFGYFHGYGKLQSHNSFEHLLNSQQLKKRLENSEDSFTNLPKIWNAYFGQFLKGNITGYGQVWLANGQKLAARWCKGSIKGKSFVLASSIES